MAFWYSHLFSAGPVVIMAIGNELVVDINVVMSITITTDRFVCLVRPNAFILPLSLVVNLGSNPLLRVTVEIVINEEAIGAIQPTSILGYVL